MKRLFFALGIFLAAIAFLTTAAEMAARAIDPTLPSLPSVETVWRTVSPDTLIALQAQYAWSGWKVALSWPGWLTFGAPGLGLIVAFRPRNEMPRGSEYEESLFLFDELAKSAREEGYSDLGDDITPSDYNHMDLADESYAHDSILDDVKGDEDAAGADEQAPQPDPEHPSPKV